MEVDFVWRNLKYSNKKGAKSWCKKVKYFSGDDLSLDGCFSFYVFKLVRFGQQKLKWN